MNEITIQLDQLQTLLESHQEAFEILTQLLIEENQKVNLTRIVDRQQIRVRHFIDSLAVVPALDAIAAETGKALRIIDVGSGAGFPSLPLAIVRPQWSFCSLEATAKKVRFQQTAAETLKLKNLHVLHGRAEEIAHQPASREQFDVACGRALAAMPMLAELLAAFVKPPGHAVFWKGSNVQEELTAAQEAIRKMGCKVRQRLPYELPTEDNQTVTFSLVICQKTKPSPMQYPRVFGVIKKNPLGHNCK